MPRDAFKTCLFVSLIVVDGERRLLVEENPLNRPEGWYLPGGGVDHGESVIDAARREAREETGLAVEPLALLGVEQTLFARDTLRLRFLLLASPTGGALKRQRDEHSLQAAWFTLPEIRTLKLRHADALEWLERATQAAPGALAMLHVLPGRAIDESSR